MKQEMECELGLRNEEDELSEGELEKRAVKIAAKTKFAFEYYGWRKVGAL